MDLTIHTKDKVMIGLGAALMTVFAQMSIPILTVSFTMQVFGVVLISMIIGAKRGTMALCIYALIGFIGVPVFSNFKGGPGALLGPTGGYIIGFIPMAFVVGLSSVQKNKIVQWIGVYLGMGVSYLIGVIQLKIVMDLTWEKALAGGFYPFIAKDLLLVGIAVVLGDILKKQLKNIGSI